MQPETCERCGAKLPEGARFCPNCGAPVGLSSALERKVVTVVFVDLARSTQLSAAMDAERFREVLSAFYETVGDELVALGGRPVNFIGDAVLGVFGIPLAHDDDALRGVRAAVAIVGRVGQLGARFGLSTPLQVRIGVNTGSVAIGADPADQNVVLGAEVHLAARLEQAAELGEILAGETTWLLTRGGVEFGPERRIEAKGFEEEVTAWPVVALAPGTARRRIAMVDRQRELALLTDTYRRAVERERAHLVTLLGEPGIGKSRVVEEFLSTLPPDTAILRGRSSPFEEDASFSPLAQMLLGELEEEPGVSTPRARALLEKRVGEIVEPGEVAQVVDRLGLALGFGDESGEERRYRSGEFRAGLLTYLGGLARRGPIVVVFEDLHLASSTLLETVEQLVKEARKIPLLVVGVARWELLEQRPNWAGGIADAVTLWVEPLTLGDATQLAREASEDLDERDAERIARHAGGNPFFIVETVAMLRYEDVDLPPEGSALGSLLPATVQAVVAARLDHLRPQERDVVMKASIFARSSFDLDDLALIASPSDEIMAALEDEEILVRDEERPTRWRFRHDLLRDVAYESLAKRERQRLHLHLGNKLSAPEVADRYPRTIAFHLEQAARNALDLDPKDRTLADRAVDALAAAGDVSRRRLESHVAVDLYDRALAMSGPEHTWGPREAWILSVRGEAQYWMGDFPAAEDSLTRALELDPDSVLIRAHASRYLADIAVTARADHARAEELFAQSLAASRRLDNPIVLARTLLMAGWVPYWGNDLERARTMFEEALEVARANPDGDVWAEVRALVGLASITSPVGDEEEALHLASEALEIGRESGDVFTTAVAEGNVASSLRRMWRLDEALEHAERSTGVFRELGARWELASALADLGTIRRLSGDLEEAEKDLRESYRLCRELNERALVTSSAAELARILLARGDATAARQLLEEPSARLAAAEPGSVTSMLDAETVLSLADGDREGALEKARAALEEERRQGWPNPLAAQVWWTARLFGDEAAGGEDEVRRAEATLETGHWIQALKEPELVFDVS